MKKANSLPKFFHVLNHFQISQNEHDLLFLQVFFW